MSTIARTPVPVVEPTAVPTSEATITTAEIYRLSVRAVGVTPKPQLKRHELNGAGAKPRASRAVHFDSSGSAVDTPLYVRDDLPAGARLDGPAIVDQLDSTTVVPPGWRAEVDEWLNIRMQWEGQG